MPRQLNQLRYLSAAGVLALGTACAANVYLKPPSYRGPNTAQLRQLADRVTANPPVEAAPLYVPPARHVQVTSVAPPPPPRKPAAAPTTQSPPLPVDSEPTESEPTPEAAVKQIALSGVTQQGDAPTAWLVDIGTLERETVAPGESAFGFVVKEIGTESVRVSQHGEEFTIHMGDKEIPVVEPDPSQTPAVAATPNPGNGQSGRWSRRSFGGGNWSGRSGGGGNSWSGGSGNRSRFSGGNSSNNYSRNRFSGNFGGFGGQNVNQSRNRNSTLNRPTSNPQEARRRGSRLMGGADPLPTPAAIRNPQTSRRRGTTSGRAFGSDPNWRY